MLRTATRALVVGMTESGKSTLLHDLFVKGHPRVIHIDINSEALDHPSDDVLIADGIDELRRVLSIAAEYDEWRVAAFLDEEEMRGLFEMLMERNGAHDQSLCRQLGGVAIECGEVLDLNTLIREKGSLVARAWTRGRHECLSLLMGGHSPHRCDKIIREQSDHIIAFMQTEPADVEWLQDQIGRAGGDAVRGLAQYEFVYWIKGERVFRVYNRHRQVVRVVRLDGVIEMEKKPSM